MIECPFCGTISEVSSTKGESFNCPKCSKIIKLGEMKTARYGESHFEQAEKDKSNQKNGTTNSPFTPIPLSEPIPTDSEPFLPAGTKLGQYEIREPIGRGGMGTVYKAYQPLLDRFVAIKVLPVKLTSDPEFVKRFNREAKALAGLSHLNIVTIYDIGQENHYFYFVMEFVDGVTIRTLLEERKLSPEEALKIVPQLCDALEYAHSEKVVHRDIKPENILIDKKNRVKIADFGLAKIIKGDMPYESITRTREIMGTFDYMAPEQRKDPKSVDHRADIYSLGVVFYEMLTGELPTGRFALPSKRVHIDIRLDEVVLKALEKEPGRRYQRVSELSDAISEATGSGSNRKSRYWSTKAVSAFILAFIPLVITQIASIILAILAIRSIKRSQGFLRGIGLAISAIIVSLVVLIVIKYNYSANETNPAGNNKELNKIQSDVLDRLCLANEIYRRANFNDDYTFSYAESIQALCENKTLSTILGTDVKLIAQADAGVLGEKAMPYKGYLYRMLPENKPKEAIYQEDTFTIAAYPAISKNDTLVPNLTFIIDQRGIVYAKALGNLKYPATWNSYQLIEVSPGKWDKKEIDCQSDAWIIIQHCDLSDTRLKSTWANIKPKLPQITSSYKHTPEDIKIINHLKEYRLALYEDKNRTYAELFEKLKKELDVDIKLDPSIYINFSSLLHEKLFYLKLINISGESALKTILKLSGYNLTYEIKKGTVYIIWRHYLLPPLDEKPILDSDSQKLVQNLINRLNKSISESEYNKAWDVLAQLYNLIPESDEILKYYQYLKRATQVM